MSLSLAFLARRFTVLLAGVVGCSAQSAESTAADAVEELPACDGLSWPQGDETHVTRDMTLARCRYPFGAKLVVDAGATLTVRDVDMRGIDIVAHGKVIADGWRVGSKEAYPSRSELRVVELRGSGTTLRNVDVGLQSTVRVVDAADVVIDNLKASWGTKVTCPRTDQLTFPCHPVPSGTPLVLERSKVQVRKFTMKYGEGSAVDVSGGDVSIEDAHIEWGRGTAVILRDEGRLRLDRVRIALWDAGVTTRNAWLVVENSVLEKNRGDAIAALGDPGPLPERSCINGRFSHCPAGPRRADPPGVDFCPIVRDSVIAENDGLGIRLETPELLQVSGTRFTRNKKGGVLINARWLHPETFVTNNWFTDNGEPLGGSRLRHGQVQAPRYTGVLELRHNAWSPGLAASVEPDSIVERDGERLWLLSHISETPWDTVRTYQCGDLFPNQRNCLCVDVCSNFSYGLARVFPEMQQQ